MGFALSRPASRRPHGPLLVPAIAVLLAALSPAAGLAQYIFLDTNGDGVNTALDAISPTDTTWVDIWLDTGHFQNGSPAACGQTSEPLTIFSYEFILRAVNGSVQWGPYANAQAAMTVPFGEGTWEGDYHNGFGGIEPQPAGLYRLGTLGVVAATGTPMLEIAADSPGDGTWYTSFGSLCPGADGDNTMKLGTDWSDWSGAAWGGTSPNHRPVLDPIADVTAAVGDTTDVPLRAEDPDGDPVSFTRISGPLYMTVQTLDPGAGVATGRARLMPWLAAPSGSATVRAADALWYSDATFHVQVVNLNTPPSLHPVQNMSVWEGETGLQTVIADDPDGQLLAFSLSSAPAFLSVEPDMNVYGRALLRAQPVHGDQGLYYPTLLVHDGIQYDEGRFQLLVVRPANRAPALDSIPDLFVAEGAESSLFLTAVDPDADLVEFRKVTGPDWISVSTILRGPEQAVGWMTAAPAYPDSGVHEVWVGVSDGELETMQMLHVHVANTFSGETSFHLESLPGDAIGEGRTYCYTEVDAPYLLRARPDGSGWFTLAVPCTVFTYSTPAERASCCSGLVAVWDLVIGLAGGAPLAVGRYTGAAVGTTILPDRPILSVSGADPYRWNARSCASGTGSFEILRLERTSLGRLLSFHGTFEQTCDGSTAPLRGELRYHSMSPPLVLVAPTRARAALGRLLHVPVTATSEAGDAIALSAEDMPEGMTFTDRGDRSGYLCWTPSPGQQGPHLVRLLAASAGGLRDTSCTLVDVTYANRAPHAEANGPYSGASGAPIAMSSAGCSDPDGDALTYSWDFGDGGTSDRPSPEHAYAANGSYDVTLTVSDGGLSASDGTWADVGPQSYPSYVAAGGGTVRLSNMRASLCVGVDMEPVGSRTDDVLPDGFWLVAANGGAADSIAADPSLLAMGDRNGNGLRDAVACFDCDDLRRLFCSATGRSARTVQIHLRLESGRFVTSDIQLDVAAPEGALPVAVAPNPMNPGGMLTVFTSQPGRVRVRLYDTAGRMVRTLLDAASLPAGYHDVPVDGHGEQGSLLASGAYFYRVEAAEGTRTGRIAIVR